MSQLLGKRLHGPLLCVCLAMFATGCAMCHTEFDDAYSAYGGIRERQDPFHGRVGSILSDPAMQYAERGGMGETATEDELYRDPSELGAAEDAEEI